MSKHILLPPALCGDKKNLSAEARKEIQNLCGNRPFQFLLQAFGAWVVIFIAIGLSLYFDNIWVTLLSIFIVGTRFNVLGLLAHDQTHWSGLRGRYGDVLSNILVAYPIGLSVENYAKVHLSHHRHYFTDEDPDFLRKTGADWAFPMSYSRLASLLFRDLIGFSFVKFLRGKKLKDKNIYNRKYASPAWVRPAYYGLLLALVSYFNVWSLFLIYWVIPLISLMPLIVRFGAICEHVYGASKATVVDSSPLILLSWWEKLLLPNLNFTLHVYHHFFPSVPFCNLPKVHEIFQREGLVNEKNVFHGYWSYLQFLQTESKTTMISIAEQDVITTQ